MQASASEILRQSLLLRKSRNPAYSLRAFARDLGVSHSYLSQVISEKLPLSVKQVMRFGQLLDRESPAFGALLRTTSLPTRRKEKTAAQTFFVLDIDRFKIFSDWYHFAIQELTQVKGFRGEPRWIARRLGIS